MKHEGKIKGVAQSTILLYKFGALVCRVLMVICVLYQ